MPVYRDLSALRRRRRARARGGGGGGFTGLLAALGRRVLIVEVLVDATASDIASAITAWFLGRGR
jgi:hypothetical protein